MSVELAHALYVSARAHALSSALLFEAAHNAAVRDGMADPNHFAFNGTFSLSTFYLIGLGLELYFKSAILLLDPSTDRKFVSNVIRHDLSAGLQAAKDRGFNSKSPNLDEIVRLISEPYLEHNFRYERPDRMPLPDINQVIEMFAVLDDEFRAMFGDD